MANIESVLGQVERWREGGEDIDRGIFAGLLAWVEDRGQLERLFAGLDGADQVVARCDQFLARTSAVELDEDGLEELALRHLEELLALARRRRDDGSATVAAFEALVDVAIAVDDEPSGDLLRLDGTGFGVVPAEVSEWAELSKAHLDLIQIEDFELIAAEISGVEPNSWQGEQDAVLSAAQDLRAVGAWLLAPVASWEFDFEPAFRLWEAGSSLLLGADGVEVVTGAVRFDHSVNGYTRAKPHKVEWTAADREWEAANGDGGKAALRIVAKEMGGPPRSKSITFEQLGLSSLPPALKAVEGLKSLYLVDNPEIDLSLLADLPNLTSVSITGCAGVDLSVLADLTDLESLAVSGCELDSFDVELPAGLTKLLLSNNKLTTFPDNLTHMAPGLEVLSFEGNKLTVIPDAIAEFQDLHHLYMHKNEISEISPAIANLGKLKTLDLSDNKLTELPDEILNLPSDCTFYLLCPALPGPVRRARNVEELRAALNT